MTAKEANAALDAVDRGTLETALPGIGAAFDRTAMRSYLQQALIGRQALTGPQRSARVQRCSLTSAVLLDDECVVRYELGIEDGAGRARTALVTARIYPDAQRAAAYEATRLAPLVSSVLGREETAPLTSPVAVIEPLAAVAYAFPIDGELPTLAGATDPTAVARVAEELLAASGLGDLRIEGCRAELVHYSRQHRCMLRYHLDLAGDRKSVLYGKVAADGSGQHIPGVVAALRPILAAAGVAVPECLGFREDLQLVMFTEIPGVPRVAQLLKASLRGEPTVGEVTVEDAVEACGRIAATLHRSGLRLGASRPLSVELARLRAGLRAMMRLSPEIGARLGARLKRAETAAASTSALELCLCHGDFSYTQLIFDGPRAGLVDFDNFCQAEPALDLGQFLAYLRYAGVKARGNSAALRAGLVEGLARRFTAAYAAAGGPTEALDRVAMYEAASLVRMAQHAWQNLKPRRLHDIVTVLDERLHDEP